MNDWISTKDRLPEDDGWRWVTDGKSVWPAFWDAKYAGEGVWTNGDCWEDFEGAVIAWHEMPKPELPRKVESQL